MVRHEKFLCIFLKSRAKRHKNPKNQLINKKSEQFMCIYSHKFTITSLARTTAQTLTIKTRRNIQNDGFSAP
ncbi:hypothetical protein XBI1_2680003 [Xenorhabdus bovienii str. Intermedium]|uniref:Uncharacterized protein n=1 Tax=Xenorhabdus bovienii str. Intermedium TaxID=1379677 RepID=A0A077QBH4_XENBV|nr:hypothetical protein XBI1_2680003 [Xenorhabdus bovienii str. Intermedium]